MYFVEKTKGTDFFRHFDYFLFTAVLLLSAIGITALSSATRNMASGSSILKTQIISLALGIILSLVISAIDYKDFKTLGIIIYVVSIILLILVLFVGTGQQQVGTNGWFRFAGFSFQPSEAAKIAVILVISIFLERIQEAQGKHNKLKLLIYTFIPVALVLKQPDMGTAMVFMSIFAAMIFVCGFPYKYILITAGFFLITSPLMWFFVLEKHQKDRFISFLAPELYAQGIGYNVVRSKLAVGSGQIFGQGLYRGIQTQSNGVPVKESDFIFSVIGEELGFIGTASVVVLVFIILMRCLYIARSSRDYYGSFLAVGITSMFAFHFIENIGASIGVLPVTGIPLPFVSQGGSALVTNYIAVGVMLSVSMRRKRAIFNSTQ